MGVKRPNQLVVRHRLLRTRHRSTARRFVSSKVMPARVALNPSVREVCPSGGTAQVHPTGLGPGTVQMWLQGGQQSVAFRHATDS